MTYLIIAGELDLSVGSLFATCAMFGGFLFKNQIVTGIHSVSAGSAVWHSFGLLQRSSGNQTGDPFFYRYTGYDENAPEVLRMRSEMARVSASSRRAQQTAGYGRWVQRSMVFRCRSLSC